MKPSLDTYSQTPPETMETVRFIYSALISSTKDPREAAEVISAVFVTHWLNSAAKGADLDKALAQWCEGIKLNVENNQARKQ